MGRLENQGKRGEWSERLRRRRESGLTVAEFCEWEGVSVASFYNWQKKLRVEKSRSRSTAVIAPQIKSMPPVLRDSFLPVHITQPTLARLAPTCIEIRMANGVRIFVPIIELNSSCFSSIHSNPQESARWYGRFLKLVLTLSTLELSVRPLIICS